MNIRRRIESGAGALRRLPGEFFPGHREKGRRKPAVWAKVSDLKAPGH